MDGPPKRRQRFCQEVLVGSEPHDLLIIGPRRCLLLTMWIYMLRDGLEIGMIIIIINILFK